MSAVKKKRDIVHEVVIEEEDAPGTVADVLVEEADEPETEPEIEMVEFEFKGTTFTIPKSRDDWSTAGFAFLSEDKFNLFVKENLELARPGQWRALCALCPRRRDYIPFWQLVAQVMKEECTD